jgi:hypothetical protein
MTTCISKYYLGSYSDIFLYSGNISLDSPYTNTFFYFD